MNVLTLIEAAEKAEAAKLAAQTDVAPPDDYVDEELPEVRGPWQITTAASLDWAMSRLAALRAEIASIEEQRTATIERITKRAELLTRKAERGCDFFQMRIADFAQHNRTQLLGGGKKKSRDLIHGRIGWRSKAGRVVVTDKDALVAWLERQSPDCGLYRLKVEPDMKALSEHFATTNQLPPGTDWQMPEESFYVEPASPETEIERVTP